MKVKLKDVLLSFPHLFEPQAMDAKSKPKFKATFVFPKDHPAAKAVKDAMVAVAKEKWADKAAEIYKSLKAANRLCLHDGDEKAKYAGFAGNLFVNASNGRPVPVVDGQKAPLTFAGGKIYAGCYVLGIVDIYAQDDPRWGKRINASLTGVQFMKDGEPLAGGSVATEDDFEELPEEGVTGEAFASDGGDEDPFA